MHKNVSRLAGRGAAILATACVATAAGTLAAHAAPSDAVAPDYTCVAVEGPNNDTCTFTTSAWVGRVEDSGWQHGRRVISVQALPGHTFADGRGWATLTFVDLGKPFVTRPPLPSGEAQPPVEPNQPMPTLYPANKVQATEGAQAAGNGPAKGPVVTVVVPGQDPTSRAVVTLTPGATVGTTPTGTASNAAGTPSPSGTVLTLTPTPGSSATPNRTRSGGPLGGGRYAEHANVAAQQTVSPAPDGRKPVTVSALGVGVSTALLTLAGPATIAVASSRRRAG